MTGPRSPRQFHGRRGGRLNQICPSIIRLLARFNRLNADKRKRGRGGGVLDESFFKKNHSPCIPTAPTNLCPSQIELEPRTGETQHRHTHGHTPCRLEDRRPPLESNKSYSARRKWRRSPYLLPTGERSILIRPHPSSQGPVRLQREMGRGDRSKKSFLLVCFRTLSCRESAGT